MFYLSKIAADDRIARNFDFEPIRFERLREKISSIFIDTFMKRAKFFIFLDKFSSS